MLPFENIIWNKITISESRRDSYDSSMSLNETKIIKIAIHKRSWVGVLSFTLKIIKTFNSLNVLLID